MTTSSSSAERASRMRGLSASECAGLALSTSMPRKRRGWSVRISSGITLAGIRPVITRWPPTGEVFGAPPPPPPPRLARCECRFMAPRRAKFPVSRYSSFSMARMVARAAVAGTVLHSHAEACMLLR